MLNRYNPNLQWGMQRVKITLQRWQYRGTFYEKVGGNTHGISVMDCAISNLYDRLREREECPFVALADTEGDLLICEEDDKGEDWLQRMVVGVEIVEIRVPTINDERRKYGQELVPDGYKEVDYMK